MTTEFTLTAEQKATWERDGFLVIRGLLSPAETASLREKFMQIQRDALELDSELRHFTQPQTAEASEGDVLKQFPRVMHPHRFDEQSKAMMLDGRVENVLSGLFGEEPLAAQSMFYFKPPGARGQALHQDNFYLKVSPGTCIAAWVSLDDADSENGTLFVVPGSHHEKIHCPHAADLSKSFTMEEVDIPAGMEQVEVQLAAGDVLFFNGSLIHGSYPNSSNHRFRRSFICHYVGQSTTEMNSGYYPLHDFDGNTIQRGDAQGGGICGTEEWAAFQAGVRAQMKTDSPDMEWLKHTAVG